MSARKVVTPVDHAPALAAHRQFMEWASCADTSDDLMRVFAAVELLAREANAASRYVLRRGGEVVDDETTFEEVERHRDEAYAALLNLRFSSVELCKTLRDLAQNPSERAKVAALFFADAMPGGAP